MSNLYEYSYSILNITPLDQITSRDRRALDKAVDAASNSPFPIPRRIGSCILSKGLYVQGEE